MISQRTIQEVLNTAQVQDIIEDYVTLKRRGANLLGLCPFHNEKSASFTVSPSKNIYKCFGCGKGGGAVQFLMDHDSLSFPESIRTLARRYNIEIEEDNKQDEAEYLAQKKAEESYYILNDFAGDYFKKNLFETHDGKAIALSYFKERGFIDETIKKFELGYAPNESKGLTEKALAAQYNKEFLTTLGLTSAKGYDFFRNRVMFTIHNVSGKIIAFAGRTLSTGKSQPKYINSPETPIYNKRKVLYGMHLAKNDIRKKDNCFIVEGYTDVISLVQNGVENVVASSGTSLTSDQVRLVKRFTSNITFLYDGDPAGIKAAMRGLDIVLESDMNVKLVLLPEGEDPDSFITKSGNEKFLSYVESTAKDFIFFKMDLLMEDAGNDPIKKTIVIKDIISSIAKVRDPIKRSLYVQQAAAALSSNEALLVKEVNKLIRTDIKKKKIEKDRAEKRSQLKQGGQDPQEPAYMQGYEEMPYDPNMDTGYDPIVEPKVHHKQPSFKKTSHEYQEKDLARIIVCAGDTIIKDENDQEIVVADFIYSNIFDIFQYFENELYKDIINEGFEFIESGTNSAGFSISDHFINHNNPKISNFAINANASPYEFAEWDKKDVFLQTQPLPEKNFFRDSLQSILRFKLKKMNTVIKMLSERAASTDGSVTPEQLKIILKGYQKLTAERAELAEKLGTVIL